MKIKPDKGECPYCHFDLEQYQEEMQKRWIHYLQPGSILNGRYMIGKVLGEGGFGITYIGWNLNLEMPIAIKEYFPNGFVMRNTSQTDTVSVLSGEGKEKFYLKQKERFLDEAKTLGRLCSMESIVSVRDCFAENGTAYIIMEYLDGKDFGKFLRENGGKLPANQVFYMMEPIIKALGFIHKDNQGLIHRDISPDNIRVTQDSKIKLMDFGAARKTDDEKSLSVVLKPGYAPEEQYRTRGKQGPWTDVYGVCATMYRAITGKKPIESLERIVEDDLKAPSELGISIDEKQEKALMKGLAVLSKNRWQSMDELHEAIYFGKQQNSYNKSEWDDLHNLKEEQQKLQQELSILRQQIQDFKKTRKELEEQIQEQEQRQKQLQRERQFQSKENGQQTGILQKQQMEQKEKAMEQKEKALEAISVLENKNISQISQSNNNKRSNFTIAINAGYEDKWGRAYGRPSLLEGKFKNILNYELNLTIARELQNKLENRGYRVIMTRNSNEEVQPLPSRLRTTEVKEADILLTLHCGTDISSKISSREGGARTIIAKEFIGEERNEFHLSSGRLAKWILNEYCKATGLSRRECLESNLVENISTKMTSVILEIGCLGNMRDEYYMTKEENQKTMAEGIANGIDLYYDTRVKRS